MGLFKLKMQSDVFFFSDVAAYVLNDTAIDADEPLVGEYSSSIYTRDDQIRVPILETPYHAENKFVLKSCF